MFNLYTAIILTALLLLLITAIDILTNRLITGEMKKWAVLACLLIAGSMLGECVGVLVLTLLMLFIGVGIQFIYSDIRIDFLCIAIGNMLLDSRCNKIVLQLDAVTCLLNRRCYDAALGTIGPQAVIIFFDINRFKQVNDTYGHSTGDLCLKNLGKHLRTVYGKFGSCYRVGGDEFCVILDSHIERLDELNGQFMDAVEAMRQENPRMPDVAYGYAYYNSDTGHIQRAIEAADEMMYKNKHANSRNSEPTAP